METKKSNFEKGIDFISALRIIASSTLLGLIIGFVIYKISDESNRGALIAGFITGAGLVIGIIWALNVSKKLGTTDFLSKVDASPDIDEAVKDKN